VNKPGKQCAPLLEETADALSGNVVSLMLLSVQKDNLELNIKQAVKWYVFVHDGTRMSGAYSHYRVHSAFRNGRGSRERVIKLCLWAFPSIWVSCDTEHHTGNCPLLKDDCYLELGQSFYAHWASIP
jgi:hypothetical protein